MVYVVTVNINKQTYEDLCKRKGFLEIKFKQNFSMDRVINYLMDNCPDLAFPIDESEGIYIKMDDSIEIGGKATHEKRVNV